jgi:hypothetical protein
MLQQFGFKTNITTRGFRSNIYTSTISTFVMRRKWIWTWSSSKSQEEAWWKQEIKKRWTSKHSKKRKQKTLWNLDLAAPNLLNSNLIIIVKTKWSMSIEQFAITHLLSPTTFKHNSLQTLNMSTLDFKICIKKFKTFDVQQ